MFRRDLHEDARSGARSGFQEVHAWALRRFTLLCDVGRAIDVSGIQSLLFFRLLVGVSGLHSRIDPVEARVQILSSGFGSNRSSN